MTVTKIQWFYITNQIFYCKSFISSIFLSLRKVRCEKFAMKYVVKVSCKYSSCCRNAVFLPGAVGLAVGVDAQ